MSLECRNRLLLKKVSLCSLLCMRHILLTCSCATVRKAYRKRALQTHPDRLPQGSTSDQKSAAEEQFRQGELLPHMLRTD